MIEYKDFMKITDKEIIFILQDIFNAIKVSDIIRDTDFRQIYATIATEWEGENENEVSEIEDEVTLYDDRVVCSGFSITANNILQYMKFMLAKGYSTLLKDNKYLSQEI